MNKILQHCSPYDTPEWEIPKGRKDYNETNINCAIREFKEETSFEENDYNILDCINPIHDIFIGTNNKVYKHVFYIGLSNTDIKPYVCNNEIDEIRWCNWEEAINLIRPYNENKINILTNIFLFIVNICEQYI
jgi:8-oxo-dGTP pyrophosphatase MutT (NUDIX family)